MASVFLHSPLNINLSLAAMLRAAVAEIGKKNNTEVTVKSVTCHQREDGQLPLTIAELEDMVITYGSDLAALRRDGARSWLRPCAGRFPLRQELSTRGFEDAQGYFHPIFLIPLIIIYNQRLVPTNEAPQKWEDLLSTKWRKRILFPERHLPASRALLALMQDLFPDRLAELLENVVFQGSPVDVKNAVDAGQFPIGVNKVAFARFARNKNVAMVWPREGAFGLPNIMLWRAGADEVLLGVGDFLRSTPMQEFFLKNGYIPVSAEVPMLSEAEGNGCRLLWKGWDWFLNMKGDVL
jgi:hypothetical protein